jgi:hypothetical protein
MSTLTPLQQVVLDDLLTSPIPELGGYATLWAQLSDDEFLYCVKASLPQRPLKVFAAWHFICKRIAHLPGVAADLFERFIQQVRFDNSRTPSSPDEALTCLTVTSGSDPLPAFEQYSDDAWWLHHEPTLELLVALLFESPDMKARKDLVRRVAPSPTSVPPVLLYRTVFRCVRERAQHRVDYDNTVGDWIKDWAWQWMVAAGFERGVVTIGIHREVEQVQVRISNRLYVPDRRSHRYFPRAGEKVLFRKNGRQLSSRVTVVFFMPDYS